LRSFIITMSESSKSDLEAQRVQNRDQNNPPQDSRESNLERDVITKKLYIADSDDDIRSTESSDSDENDSHLTQPPLKKFCLNDKKTLANMQNQINFLTNTVLSQKKDVFLPRYSRPKFNTQVSSQNIPQAFRPQVAQTFYGPQTAGTSSGQDFLTRPRIPEKKMLDLGDLKTNVDEKRTTRAAVKERLDILNNL